MKKFFTGMIAGVLMTLYLISSLGSQSDPLKGSAGLLKEAGKEMAGQVAEDNRDDASKKPLYKENIKIINKQPVSEPFQEKEIKAEEPETGKKPDPFFIAATEIIEKTEPLPHYKMNLTGPGGTKEGKVLISSDNSVWCELKTLSEAMGWKLASDGGVYSVNSGNTLLFKVDHQKLVSAGEGLFVSLSYLKSLWLLNFSVNPASHTLELSLS